MVYGYFNQLSFICKDLRPPTVPLNLLSLRLSMTWNEISQSCSIMTEKWVNLSFLFIVTRGAKRNWSGKQSRALKCAIHGKSMQLRLIAFFFRRHSSIFLHFFRCIVFEHRRRLIFYIFSSTLHARLLWVLLLA